MHTSYFYSQLRAHQTKIFSEKNEIQTFQDVLTNTMNVDEEHRDYRTKTSQPDLMGIHEEFVTMLQGCKFISIHTM